MFAVQPFRILGRNIIVLILEFEGLRPRLMFVELMVLIVGLVPLLNAG
jgi:hypothetical protein